MGEAMILRRVCVARRINQVPNIKHPSEFQMTVNVPASVVVNGIQQIGYECVLCYLRRVGRHGEAWQIQFTDQFLTSVP